MHGRIFCYTTDIEVIEERDISIPIYEDISSFISGVDYADETGDLDEIESEYKDMALCYGLKNYKIYKMEDEEFGDEHLIMEVPKEDLLSALNKSLKRKLKEIAKILKSDGKAYDKVSRIHYTINPSADFYFADENGNMEDESDLAERLDKYNKESDVIYFFSVVDYHV